MIWPDSEFTPSASDQEDLLLLCTTLMTDAVSRHIEQGQGSTEWLDSITQRLRQGGRCPHIRHMEVAIKFTMGILMMMQCSLQLGESLLRREVLLVAGFLTSLVLSFGLWAVIP